MSGVPAIKIENRKTRKLKEARPKRELSEKELRFAIELEGSFSTTAELAAGEEFAGQERALSALELGVGIHGGGFNIFVSGLTGAESFQALKHWIREKTAAFPTPGDWVYVHNFNHPDAPRAIYLGAGQGGRLRELMRHLVKSLREELPKVFRQEAFAREKELLRDKYDRRAQELSSQFDRLAAEKGFSLRRGASGAIYFIPIVGGKPLRAPDEFARLSPAEQETIEKHRQELTAEMERMMTQQQEIVREMEEDVRLVERRFCENLLAPLIVRIANEIKNEEVGAYLDEVKEYALNNLDDFKESGAAATLPFFPVLKEPASYIEYEVNVVVDNAETQGPPVLVESSPTYLNLFGTIERVVDRFGRVVTNFTRIKSGSLLRAHGGYLILNLEDALIEPAVWKVLRRTLRSGRIEMETYEPFALFSASGLRPEPVDIDTKVIVVGSSMLYQLLYIYDEEFREIFKVKADFRDVMEMGEKHRWAYARWLAKLCQEEGLPHFDRGAIERLLWYGAREAEDREKISASYPVLANLAREAAYWARQEESPIISSRHVEQALGKRVFRSNWIEERIRELVAQGTILIDIEGKKVGQVNGLSVLEIGDYRFGRPSRVTASVAMGQAGIINIERESRLSGSIHDKGVLILSGYLRNRYGQDKPLALSASLCFEQSYSGVEGDSASSAELYALLSRLSDIPLRQDIAVTGSVNQCGEVQAIGGVNEKIEGFYDTCRAKGITGNQGVLIPAANVRNLILRDDVVQAVTEGKFHVYPVSNIDEGLEVLTGLSAGEVDEEGTVNQAVSSRLKDLAWGLRAFMGGDRGQSSDRAEAR
jgi:ATP-dependent Lon protease